MDSADAIAADVRDWQEIRPDIDLEPVELGLRLRWLRRALDQREAQLAESQGVGLSEWWILASLRRARGSHTLPPSELASMIGLTSSAVTKRIDALEKLELISRGHDHRDGRVKLVKLTEAGRELADRLFEQEVAISRRFQSVLSPAERRELNRMLAALIQGVGAIGRNP